MARALLSMVLLAMTRDFDHNLSLRNNYSIGRGNSNINYTKIINFWEEHKNEFILHDEHEEVVLVMGNTGAGKTTVISALVGRKLKSIRQDGYFVIVDEDGKIGNGTSSRTLIPELMTDFKRNVTYVDCAGFRDNRDVEHEISSVYFQNILMNQVKRIKLTLIINYDSLKINGNKNDFDDLMEHIGEFIKDIPKFHNGIAIVATKVENLYEMTDNGTLILVNDDQSVLKGIANFLQKKKETYIDKAENSEKYRMFAGLIDVLLESKNDSYTRITLFRQPTRTGLLENIPESRNQINNIGNMIVNNLCYVKSQKSDFGFALSKSLKSTVDEIVDDIFRDALTNRLKTMGNETLTFYLQMEEEYNDIEMLQERVTRAYNTFSQVDVDEPLAFFKEYLSAANILNIPLSLTNIDIISDDIEKLYFFTTISNSNEDTHMLLLKNDMQNIVDSIEQMKDYYDFLNNVHENLAAYKSQNLRNDTRITNIITSCTSSTNSVVQNIMDLENIVNEIGSNNTYQKIKTLTLNRFQLKHLKDVFRSFTTKLDISCVSSSKQMVVKGYNIRISDVVKMDCWTNAKIVQIFALNKVFIDSTLNKTGAEMQLSLIAPTWEVVGGPKIILDGKAGEPHEKESAKSSSFNSENGANGLPGHPGGPAGHFFGVGKHFINSEYLEIYTNGGIGGPGQHGGNGADGIPGEALSDLFFEIKRQPNDVKNYLINNKFEHKMIRIEYTPNPHHIISRYAIDVIGKLAIEPSNGGNGGTGGKGGYPGKIIINSLGKSVNIKLSNDSGHIGREGQGGHGGKKTSEGKRVKFKYLYQVFTPPFPWKAEYYDIEWSDGAEVPSGKDGIPGINDDGQKFPTKTSVPNFYSAINDFKDFVRMNLFENIMESKLKSFIYEFENDNNTKAQYSTLAYVKEFAGLESQFLELRNKINLIPFYNSVLTRIEEYAKSELNLENKKVLNYIYTAALTEVFTLKKKRKGQTVVDLYRYLNTIETHVKEIREAQQLQIVQQYRDEYKDILNNKIREAEGFIQNQIEPEIDKRWNESDSQIQAIIDEINKNINSTKDALELLEKDKSKINHIMQMRAMFLPLKLVGVALSFFGPIGAGIGTVVTGAASIAEGLVVDKVPGQRPEIPSIDPHLKAMSRVTKILDDRNKQSGVQLTRVTRSLEEFVDDLSVSREEKMKKRRIIFKLRTQLQEAMFRKAESISDVISKQNDIDKIREQLADFTKSEKDSLQKQEEEGKDDKDEEKKAREKSLRQIKNVKIIIDSVKVIVDFASQIKNDEAMMSLLDKQMSKYYKQIEDLQEMEQQVYDIILPDFRKIEETINEIRNSANGSSHAQLDISKWTVRSTLRDVKSLLQKFTQKMSFEIQSDLMRYIDKIDEGVSILIDIYDRIDSYADSVAQAEYMANIVSASMTDIHITNSELSNAVTNLRLIIQSNILLEKYGIALHAFKQHYFPFAARVLQKFELPTVMQLNDTESVRSNVIDRIRDMKNHIDESEAMVGEYSKYIHEKKIFNSNTTGSSPFYVWKYDTIKNEVQQLLNGSEILLKADISKGPFYNSIKYNDIGVNLKLRNSTLQNNLNTLLQNFALTMTMIGNFYYRCAERYYFISFNDDITISYTLTQDENKNWLDPNKVYTTILKSHTFLSPYVMWSIKLNNVTDSVSFDRLNAYANETIDIELFGRGYYIEQNANFNFEVCKDYLNKFYDVEVIAKELPNFF
ncbi:uncharacterized protein [Chelonus insularis]|uniref:uncharacterized protein n=1 Tax=Chelonus insularis TaxID=460826 RepID=UPI00158E62C0|nr:uncharacterized protein LOC118074258 [Chelonus insularis]